LQIADCKLTEVDSIGNLQSAICNLQLSLEMNSYLPREESRMTRRLPLLLAVVLVLPTTARAQLPTGDSYHGRGCAILPPVESPDKPPSHPPKLFIPYYSPLTPISVRWRPVVYIPYYCGYCPNHRVHPRRGVPYGDYGIFGPTECGYGPGVAGFGPFTGARRDEENLLHLGGNGPFYPSLTGPTDLIDVLHGGPAPAAACVPR
jgi:hypothetical protein